ncbi:hypothetical protein [Pontibacter sp. G13]|uniref:hypothetical protein n=1 Tax=Pontibacter sp. G13 TaxID=3074898 RepID=UPI00288A6817|nr:hypothetical protein [Pontibacter sp. G13]WNJ20707.1 hypothetical protein RJD25_09515 [Pontibacter sp. G13]
MKHSTNIPAQQQLNSSVPDHSRKAILARGCDPELSRAFAKAIPPQIGNPVYVPTTDDVDFFEKLKSQAWSVIYFAPGACRFDAAKRAIPGSNQETRSWSLEDYRALVRQHQGATVPIVESLYEHESLERLIEALADAPEVSDQS